MPQADLESRRVPKIALPTFRHATAVILALMVAMVSMAFGRTNLLAVEQPGNSDALAEVLVTGERPGPGMWRVSKGDHDLWILATLVPLPKKMIWRSQAVEMRIASSQVVMTPPQFTPDIGFFRGITLLPSLLRARHSPDGKTLEEALPHDLYIRWLALRVKYLGHGDEKMRPMLSAFDLYSHALDQVGLTIDDDEVWDVVKKTANAHHVPIEHIDIKVPINNPKSAIRGLEQIPRDAEIACLAKTMERLETDLQPMVRRANLWSLGDIDGLRAMSFPDEGAACADAFLAVPQLKSQFSQVDASVDSAWLLAADNALANNVSSFAVLAIAELLAPDGLLAKLRAKGYVVEEPQTERK
jgi:hypothetical protein